MKNIYKPKRAILYAEPANEINPNEIDEVLIRKVRVLYASQKEYPYHNWNHVQDILKAVNSLLDRCKKHGIKVDETALHHGIICHDLLFAVEAQLFGYQNKEELAAHYTYNLLRSLGAPEEHARKVEGIVNATNYLVEPEGIEEVLMRAADLYGIAGDYKTFQNQTRRLYLERQKVTGEKISLEEHIRMSFRILPEFFRFMLKVSPMAMENFRSKWHQDAMGNVLRIYRETVENNSGTIRVIAEVLEHEETVITQRGIKKEEFYIGIGKAEELKKYLEQSKKVQNETTHNSPVFFIPGSHLVISLPDKSCDELYLRGEIDVDSIEEAKRVLNAKGDLFIETDDNKEKIREYALNQGFLAQNRPEEQSVDGFLHFINN